jgi:hypothetical protein
MLGIMRRSQSFCALCALVLLIAGLAPVGAQSGMQPVTDARGLFSISIPSGWRVASNRMSDAVFHSLHTSSLGQNVVSTLAAQSRNDDSPGLLAVAAVDLPRRVSPAMFGEVVKEQLPSEWAVTQDGQATIAGRDAHYVYFIMRETDFALYMVLAYFNVGRTGFLVVGGTLNEPGAIRKNFATISQILETFRPSPKLGAPPSMTARTPR